MPPCLRLSIIRYISRVKWSNPGKGLAPSPTPRCRSYWKGSLLVTLNYSHQLYLLISIFTCWFLLTGICVYMWIYFFVYISRQKMYVYVYVFICILVFILFTNPSARAGYDTRSIFKRSLTGFNSEFSFS